MDQELFDVGMQARTRVLGEDYVQRASAARGGAGCTRSVLV